MNPPSPSLRETWDIDIVLLSIMRRWHLAKLLAIDEGVHVARFFLFLIAGRSGRLPVSEAAPRADEPLFSARPEFAIGPTKRCAKRTRWSVVEMRPASVCRIAATPDYSEAALEYDRILKTPIHR